MVMTGRCCLCDVGVNCHGCVDDVPNTWEWTIGTVSTTDTTSGNDTALDVPGFLNPPGNRDRTIEWSYPDFSLLGTHTISQWVPAPCWWRMWVGHYRPIRARLGSAGGFVKSAEGSVAESTYLVDPGTSDTLCGTGTPEWLCVRVFRGWRVDIRARDFGSGMEWSVELSFYAHVWGWVTLTADPAYYDSLGAGSLFMNSLNKQFGGGNPGACKVGPVTFAPSWICSLGRESQGKGVVARYRKAVNCSTDFDGTAFTLTDDGTSSYLQSAYNLTVPSTTTLKFLT